jgi:hypothetical protein
MKKLFVILTLSTVSGITFAGAPKDMKQVATTPCPEYYGDTEWDISLWGTYVFTNTDFNPNIDPVDLLVSTDEGQTVLGNFDKYIGNDHAWGGGGDIKFFWHRYFGFGVEAFGLDATKDGFDIEKDQEEFEESGGLEGFDHERTRHHRAVGAVLGTFTLRYPVPCTRYAPYAWAGAGVIWGGGESDTLIIHEPVEEPEPGIVQGGDKGGKEEGEIPDVDAHTRHYGGESKLIGHFGFGLEARFTRHIGWKTDVSWGVIDGPKNNFTMIRTGINFAF